MKGRMAFQSTPENEAKRLRAFELYMGSTAEGKRRSLRSISQELGVSLNTVQYWRDKDHWEARVSQALQTAGRAAELASQSLKLLLRDHLRKGIHALGAIVESGSARDKISAIKQLADITVRLNALDLGDGSVQAMPEWKDDLSWESSQSSPPTAAQGEELPLAEEEPSLTTERTTLSSPEGSLPSSEVEDNQQGSSLPVILLRNS